MGFEEGGGIPRSPFPILFCYMSSSPNETLVLFDGEWDCAEVDLIQSTAQEIAEFIPPRYQDAPSWTCYCTRATTRSLYIATFSNLKVDTFSASSADALAIKMRGLIEK